jgi:sulfonate transport system substrate-binding protein
MTSSTEPPSARAPLCTMTVVVLWVALICAMGCSRKHETARGDRAAPAAEATLRVGDQLFLVQSALELSGQLSDLPYKIEWSSFPSGPPLLEAVSADATDIGGVGDTPPVFARASGLRVKIVAAWRSHPEFHAIIVPAASKLRGVDELRGKKVAVAKGSAAHYVLLQALRRSKFTIADIQPVFLAPSDAQAAFARGDVDAWAIWEPFITNNQRSGARRLTDPKDLAAPLGFQVTSEKALQDPRKVALIRDFIHRLRASRDWTNAHKETWAARYAEVTKLPVDVVREMLDHYEPRYAAIDASVTAVEQELADSFSEAGVLPSPVDVKDLFDDRFNEPTLQP